MIGCLVDECTKPRKSLGWCEKHYTRFRKYGDPLGCAPTPGREALQYFWDNVYNMTDDCIVWPYRTNTPTGYGVVSIDGRDRLVHVMAAEMHLGPPPKRGMQALHTPVVCHDRLCFNWRHLRWGTNAENQADRVKDGTTRYTGPRFDRETVEAIRTEYAAGGIQQKTLAARYGVSLQTIGSIITKKTWKESEVEPQ